MGAVTSAVAVVVVFSAGVLLYDGPTSNVKLTLVFVSENRLCLVIVCLGMISNLVTCFYVMAMR